VDLPLFPLHLVLYPGRPLPLHLFEPRYLRMLRDCLDADGRFGVVAIRAGREAGVDWGAGADADVREQIHAVGTVTEIRTVAERPDGRFDIITRGCQRFRVVRPLHDRPYLRAACEVLEDPVTPDDRPAAADLREVLVPYLKDLGVPDEFCARLPEDPGELSYLAASALQVEVPVQQQLLELPTHAARMQASARIIRREAGIIRRLGLVGSFRPSGPGGAELN
jgi:Lon protease-like protein